MVNQVAGKHLKVFLLSLSRKKNLLNNAHENVDAAFTPAYKRIKMVYLLGKNEKP